MSAELPKLVLDMCFAHNGWVVGSAADPEVSKPRDYDIVVPFSEWQKASMLIPSNAKRNHFGGWKCKSEGMEVDVWPGDIGYIMQLCKSAYVWHPASGIRWIKL